ncbi:hypothetical protein Rhe02_36930 [Rhizocola hellebori]|uniref:Uncharacterized protein n=1 Tax=Rhizocola hellebori TaxID=1392758 RepID=A0A8J3Q846_9ACTN|nr:hypothetical protein Rhe02_36930 [Rhizocola hellebori]
MLVVLFAAAGCSKDPAPAPTAAPEATTASPTPAASATPGPTATAGTMELAFSVDGSGPYLLGAKLSALQGAGQLDEVKTGGETCAQNTTARGKDRWKDVRMSFKPDGTLYVLINRSTAIPTPSGAYLGNTLAALQSIYGSLGEELTKGGGMAYLVTTTSGRGIMFDLDASKKVIAMVAGDAAYLKSSFLGGTDFC